jgi:hypothetical protein
MSYRHMTKEELKHIAQPDLYPDPVGLSSPDYVEVEDQGTTRTFDHGATRDTDEEKYDYEGFLSPIVIERFGRYMHKHRQQSNGMLRDSDNWQKGIPQDQYIKSAFRHFMEWWLLHRQKKMSAVEVQNLRVGSCAIAPTDDEVEEDALCAVMFNVMGYLYEHLKKGTDND